MQDQIRCTRSKGYVLLTHREPQFRTCNWRIDQGAGRFQRLGTTTAYAPHKSILRWHCHTRPNSTWPCCCPSYLGIWDTTRSLWWCHQERQWEKMVQRWWDDHQGQTAAALARCLYKVGFGVLHDQQASWVVASESPQPHSALFLTNEFQ